MVEIVGFLDGGTNSEISDGKNVGSLEGEHEEHVRGPDADALYPGEAFDDCGIVESGQSGEIESAFASVAGDVANVFDLAGGEAQRPHFLRPEFENVFRCQFSGGHGGLETVENHPRYFGAELLRYNRANERSQGRLAKLHAIGADTVDDGGQDRIFFLQMIGYFAQAETGLKADTSVIRMSLIG